MIKDFAWCEGGDSLGSLGSAASLLIKDFACCECGESFDSLGSAAGLFPLDGTTCHGGDINPILIHLSSRD